MKIVFREHVHLHYINYAIVVVIRYIHSHTVVRGLGDVVTYALRKRSIAIINPKQIIRDKIISTVDIRPSVIVHIPNTNTQSVSLYRNAGIHWNIRKCIVTIVAIKPVCTNAFTF